MESAHIILARKPEGKRPLRELRMDKKIILKWISSKEPGYSVWLQTGRTVDRGSIPGKGKGFFL
jgi:hypothetical protein